MAEKWSPRDVLLTVGTTLRMTRFVVTDDLGAWWIRYPAYRWARHRDPEQTGWQTKIVSGLDCPFCVGQHVSLVAMALTVLTRRTPFEAPWRFLMAALSLNYVTAHVGARMGDTATEDEDTDDE